MANNYKKDQDRANSFYQNHKNEIDGMFNGDLFSVEFDNTKIAKMLDQKCGIDYLLLSQNASVFGLASRINFNSNYHKSITIRYKRKSGAKTEYQKRLDAILRSTNEIYASITMQIDVLNDRLTRAIIFESDKLYLFINKNIDYFVKKFQKINFIDGNSFFQIPYTNLIELSKDNEFRVKIVEFKEAVE